MMLAPGYAESTEAGVRWRQPCTEAQYLARVHELYGKDWIDAEDMEQRVDAILRGARQQWLLMASWLDESDFAEAE